MAAEAQATARWAEMVGQGWAQVCAARHSACALLRAGEGKGE